MAVTSSVEPAAMRPLFRRCVAFAPLLLLVLLVSDQDISARPRMPVDMPPLVLWAWDRDDDLSFIDIRDTAVAYLAATVISAWEERIPHAAPSSPGPAEGDSPGRGRPCRGRSPRAAGRERRAGARLRRDAGCLARDSSGGISSD